MPLGDWLRRLLAGTPATLEAIYLAPAAGRPMQWVAEATLSGQGLEGDRYAAAAGHWQGPDGCAVTLIRAEDLGWVQRRTGIAVMAGEHRRNLVIRGLPRKALASGILRVGQARLAVLGPRPPCGYLERLTQSGMARALRGRSGACARVLTPGAVRRGDTVRWEPPFPGTPAGDGEPK